MIVAFLTFLGAAAQELPATASPPVPIEHIANANASKSIFPIDPKNRSADWIQAYDLLKKEKPTLKISLRTGATTLSNVTDLTAGSKGTLLFVKILSNQGAKHVIIPVEEVSEILYSP